MLVFALPCRADVLGSSSIAQTIGNADCGLQFTVRRDRRDVWPDYGVVWGVFWSKENLSPLVGFFTTGPFGFVVGSIIGTGFGLARHKDIVSQSHR